MSRRSHLYPLPDASIPGVPHRELLVSAEDADWILAHQPAAFARSQPDGYDGSPFVDVDAEGPLEWSRPADPDDATTPPELAVEAAASPETEG